MKDIAIVGAGGFGREVAAMLEDINERQKTWNIIGYFDNSSAKETVVGCKYPVIGNDEDINNWPNPLDVVIAIGNSTVMHTIVSKLTNPNLNFPNIIAPGVVYNSTNVNLGQGNIFAYGCIVTCDVKICNFNIFNTRVNIGHDCLIGSYNVVMPSVCLSGNTIVGDCNFFGVGSIVLQGVKVGCNVRLGTGSVLMRNAKNDNLYMGNPAVIINL